MKASINIAGIFRFRCITYLLVPLVLWCCSNPTSKVEIAEVPRDAEDTTQARTESSDRGNLGGKAKNKVSVQLLRKLFKKTGFVGLPYEVDNHNIERADGRFTFDDAFEDEAELIKGGFRYVIAVLPDTTNYFVTLHNIPAGNGILYMIVYSKDGEELFNDSPLENYCDEIAGNRIECLDKLTIHEDMSMTYHHQSIWGWEQYDEKSKSFSEDTVCARKDSKGFIDSNGQVVFDTVKMDTINCNNLFNNRR